MTPSRPSEARRADAAAVVFALVFPSLLTLLYFVWLAGSAAWLQRASYTVGKLVQFAFPAVWVLAVQRRRPRLGCFGGRGLPGAIAFGATVFLAMLLAYHLWLKSTGSFDAGGAAAGRRLSRLGIDRLGEFLALGTFYCLIHSLLEEYYWRWFVFGQLRGIVSLRAAVIVSSLGFAAHHVVLLAVYFGAFSPATWVFSLGVAVGGAVWAVMYHRSGSLLGPWVSHLLVDLGIYAIGYDLVGHILGP